MGGIWSHSSTESSTEPESKEMALAKAQNLVASNPVVVFSKTYCPFCKRVKDLFQKLKATHTVVELDVESDGAEIQAALAQWTKQKTVPNVFIGGKHIGGCDSTMELYDAGKLMPLLIEAGAVTASTS